VRSRVAIVRCVWSASTTSRVAPLLEAIVVVGETVTPSRLQLHLVLVSRIDLLLRKGQEARTSAFPGEGEAGAKVSAMMRARQRG
jgi:hypothetical protein